MKPVTGELLPFGPEALRQVAEDIAWTAGVQLSRADVQRLLARWRPLLPEILREEPFDLVTSEGEPTGVHAPRWLCHLLGLCHRTVHVVLRTPQDLLLFQVRSARVDWPGRIDLAVTGHVRAGLSWEDAAHHEAAEELGLDTGPEAGMLVAPGLRPVEALHRRRATDSVNPPVHICHLTRLYAGTLTATGLSHLRFADGEVSALFLCTPAEATRLLAEEPERLAPGFSQSLPRYLAFSSGH